jgi:hypothetical protein
MDKNLKYWKSLVSFFETFENKPALLCKYLIEQQALDPYFVRKILAEKWGDMPDFKEFRELEDFLAERPQKSKRTPSLVEKTNAKLDKLIETEKYEDAAKLRDYMAKKGIPRTKKQTK